MSEIIEFIEPHYLNLIYSKNYLSESDRQLWIELPYPITKPPKKSYKADDFIKNYYENIDNYNEKLKLLNKDSIPDRIMKQNFHNDYLTITNGLLDCCNQERLQITYKTDYNPYYSTNLLESFELNGKVYLIRPINNNDLGVINVSKRYKNKRLKLEENFPDGIRGISVDNREEFVNLLIRFKNDLKLLRIEDVNDLCYVEYCKQFDQNIIDCRIHQDRLGVIFDNANLQIFDINIDKQLNLDRLIIENPIKFDFYQDDFVILNRDCLQLIDSKSGDNRRYFKSDLRKCDCFCSFLIDNYTVYIGTRHCLLRTDLRNFDQFEYCTHMMKYSPCYIDLNRTDSTTVLCLSNQKSNEKIVFNGDPINSLPMNIPNIIETFEMHLKENSTELCINNLEERFDYSTIGIKLLCEDNCLNLYSCNIPGDVFKQTISTNQIHSDNGNIVKDWIEKLPIPQPNLYVTNFHNLTDLYSVLNDNLDKTNLFKQNNSDKKYKRFLQKFDRLYSKDSLTTLADSFAAIWNDDDDVDDRNVDNVPEVASYDKVTSWIEANYFNDVDDIK